MTRLTRRHLLIAAAAAPVLAATAARAATHQVVIQNHRFTPDSLTVARGDTIVFVNRDGAPHTATHQPGGFDTGRLNRDQSGQVTLSRAGQYDYICAFHPSMRGRITVR